MTSKFTAQPVETDLFDGRVRDFDQLDPTAKRYVAELEDDGATHAIPATVAGSFERGEVIRYTTYLRIRARA